MESVLCDDEKSYYEKIISKYNTELQQKRIELSVKEIIGQLNRVIY